MHLTEGKGKTEKHLNAEVRTVNGAFFCLSGGFRELDPFTYSRQGKYETNMLGLFCGLVPNMVCGYSPTFRSCIIALQCAAEMTIKSIKVKMI